MNTEFQAWPVALRPRKLAPLSQPIRCKTKMNHNCAKSVQSIFQLSDKSNSGLRWCYFISLSDYWSTSFFLSHSENALFLQHQSERLCAYSLVHRLLWCPLPARIIGVSHMGTYTKANVFVTSDHTVMTKLFQLFPIQEHSSTCPFKWLQLYFSF